MGELRLSAKKFWRLSWRAYGVLAGAYHHQQVQKWARVRWLATAVYNAQRTEADTLVTPDMLLWLPGDAPPPPPMSAEEYAAEFARLSEMDQDLTLA